LLKKGDFLKNFNETGQNKGILASKRVARFLKAIVRVASKKSLRTPALTSNGGIGEYINPVKDREK
jgi:hypothetical protein